MVIVKSTKEVIEKVKLPSETARVFQLNIDFKEII